MKSNPNEVRKYQQSCKTDFWQKVFRAELSYLMAHLRGSRDVLSVGCGPAIIEAGLSKRGFCVTGLDVSREALDCAPDGVRTVIGRAEEMPFPAASFDAVIYVASLQFIDNYKTAIEKAAAVLRPGGRFIAMLLNPASAFFKKRARSPVSYVRKVKHASLKEIERAVAEHFSVRTEYALGIVGERIFRSSKPAESSLYVIRGKLKRPGRNGEE